MKLLAENGDNTLTEARVGLDANSGGLKIIDITTPQLEKEVTRIILNVPGLTGKKDSRALCIYGAPGIGKTSIPKTIIRKWNEEHPSSLALWRKGISGGRKRRKEKRTVLW